MKDFFGEPLFAGPPTTCNVDVRGKLVQQMYDIKVLVRITKRKLKHITITIKDDSRELQKFLH
jgi:hypothetical protein